MKRILFICCTGIFLLARPGASAQDSHFPVAELNGYITDLQSASFSNVPNSLTTGNLIHNRLNFKFRFNSTLELRAGLRNRIYYGEMVRSVPDFWKYVSDDDTYVDLNHFWKQDPSVVVVSNFDRLSLDWAAGKFAVTAGRQRINWSINTVWNPNDIFNAYNFLNFDYEERAGNDAVRVQYFVNPFSSLELAASPGRGKDQNIAALLYKTNHWKYDFQVLAGIDKSDLVAGAGWAGNLGDAGFKGEMSYFKSIFSDVFIDHNFTASIMMDYSLKNAWYLSGSVLYVQNPVPVLLGSTSSLFGQLSAKSLMPYRWSYFLSAMKSFTPIVSANFSVIYSPEDRSCILFPTISYNVAQNFDLDLTGQSFFSSRIGKFRDDGNSIYLRMKWSF